MSISCEDCGAPDARLLCRWPAHLCESCARARSANAKLSEAAVDEPTEPAAVSETAAKRSAKLSRKRQRKEDATAALANFRKTFGLQCALIRLVHRGGAHDAAFVQARSLLASFVRLAYASTTGAKLFEHSLDRMIAAVRVSELIDADETIALMGVVSLCETGPVNTETSTGKIIAALEMVALGPQPTGPFASKSLKRRQVREADRAVNGYDPSAFEPIGRADIESFPQTVIPGRHHRLRFARQGDTTDSATGVGGKFDDTPEGLRALANAVIGLQDRIPEGTRLIVESVEPWTGDEVAIVEPPRPNIPADHPLIAAGLVHESDVIRLLECSWQTWVRQYRTKIPGKTTATGRWFTRETLRDWLNLAST